MVEHERSTYKAFGEIRPTLSPTEERFERWRNTLGLFLGPIVALALYLTPMPTLTPKGHMLAAIIGWVVTWWVTEPIPIPVTALLGAMLCVPFGVSPARNVFAPFSDPIIYLFLGSFILAEAMAVHGLDKRFAYGIMSMQWVGNSSVRILLAYGAITAAISAWMSNTATTAMMFPIGLGIIVAMADMMVKQTGKAVDPYRLRYGTGMMLMAAYASSVGGIATPVGTPPNLIAIGMIEKLVKVKIPFFQWMVFAVPIMIVMYVVLFFLMKYIHKPEMTHVEGSREYVIQQRQALGPWSRGQKNALFAFLLTVALWVIPGFLALLFGADAPVSKAYNNVIPEAVAALIGAALLFTLPVDWNNREFTISWRQASKIDWGTLLLFGGGLSLGNLMFETKLAEAVGKGILDFSGATSLWGITFISILIAVLITEVTSNTAAANMVVPVVISLSVAANVSPIPPAIGAALGASLAFMLPVSTPPNAIVYGSGMVPVTKMIRTGIYFDAVSIVVIWLGLRLLLPLIGLA
jgi:solute carrier family 13 (sodium-dependent dicarboxylate transporter), member 2/3/5